MTKLDQAPAAKTASTSRLRRYFLTGLVIIAPAVVTIWATLWFIDQFDRLLAPLIPKVWNPITQTSVQIPGLGLVMALLIITFVGFLGANFVGRFLLSLWERVLNSTPVVRGIYKSSKQIFETLFSDQGASFRQVCMVKWQSEGVWVMGFISREVLGEELGLERGRKMYAIYMATTPNPTGGYVYFIDAKDVRILDMSVDDGFKLLISMGLLFPEKAVPGKPVAVDRKVAGKLLRKFSRKTKA